MTRDSIDIGINRYQYTVGLNNKYIIYDNDYFLEVIKLNKDTLILSTQNSVKENEKGMYISASARL